MEPKLYRIPRVTNLLKCTIILCSILSIMLAVNLYITRFVIKTPRPIIHYRAGNYKDVYCYHTPGNSLPFVSEDFSPPERTIFFIESSCSGGLNSRQACSVEAAAKSSLNWLIVVFFLGPIENITLTKEPIRILKSLANVQLLRINTSTFTNGTILEKYFAKKLYKLSKFNRVVHISDALRLLTLNKYGGVYLDLDTLIVKPLDSLPKNFVTKEYFNAMASSALAFSRNEIGRNFSAAALREFVATYQPFTWSYNGPKLIYRILQNRCNTTDVLKMNAQTCKGIHVIDHEYFFPIHYVRREKYFQRADSLDIKREFAHHMWNSLTYSKIVPEDSLYAKLAEKFCPEIFSFYGNYFGI